MTAPACLSVPSPPRRGKRGGDFSSIVVAAASHFASVRTDAADPVPAGFRRPTACKAAFGSKAGPMVSQRKANSSGLPFVMDCLSRPRRGVVPVAGVSLGGGA